ncbi:TlpA disulfide reductase family protein [Mucilaginibacter terrae]|uniref:TlpA disulfide reductase family protein n=1 Tax=Mucilaginibacter terrae TaxID=1955052 RepID=UPI0036377356
MKTIPYLIIFILVNFCIFNMEAQINSTSQKTYKLPKLDEHSLVKDSLGKKLEYTAWTSLVATGRYEVRVVLMPDGRGSLRTVKLTKAERALKAALMPKLADSPYFTTGEAIKYVFKEKDINGDWWDAKRLKGKIVVINFWYINSMYCRSQIPDLNEVAASYKNDPNVVFLSVAMDDKKAIEEFLQYNPFDYKHIEKGVRISQKLGVVNHPTDLILDQAGKVQYHTTGYSPANFYWISKTIEKLRLTVNYGDTVLVK